MDPNRWTKIEELYHTALERPADQRSAFLAAADPELQADVESLLDQSRESLLDRPSSNLIAGARLGPYEIAKFFQPRSRMIPNALHGSNVRRTSSPR